MAKLGGGNNKINIPSREELNKRCAVELTDEELYLLMEYKKNFPTGLMGWENVKNTAKKNLKIK